ncbi:MAG: hypothetical protein IJG24_02985 [Selenomonadaceae bacterium]|nr:hypothetical protein [Selenomonadaceae bacterium]
MTPKKAAAVAKRLNVTCDESFMFACKVGSGCHVACKGSRDPHVYLTMILTLIDGVFDRLDGTSEKRKIFIDTFIKVLVRYLEDNADEENQTEGVCAEAPQRRPDNLHTEPRDVADDSARTIRAISERIESYRPVQNFGGD